MANVAAVLAADGGQGQGTSRGPGGLEVRGRFGSKGGQWASTCCQQRPSALRDIPGGRALSAEAIAVGLAVGVAVAAAVLVGSAVATAVAVGAAVGVVAIVASAVGAAVAVGGGGGGFMTQSSG
jgi:hypothetical protein